MANRTRHKICFFFFGKIKNKQGEHKTIFFGEGLNNDDDDDDDKKI